MPHYPCIGRSEACGGGGGGVPGGGLHRDAKDHQQHRQVPPHPVPQG